MSKTSPPISFFFLNFMNRALLVLLDPKVLLVVLELL